MPQSPYFIHLNCNPQNTSISFSIESSAKHKMNFGRLFKEDFAVLSTVQYTD